MRMTSAVFVDDTASDPTLQEILLALSFALDLTEGAVPGHAIRSCLLGLRIGRAAGLGPLQLPDLYYASLLKDVGCSSNSARMCQIVGGDDRIMKAGAKLADWTRPHRPQLSTLKLLWREVLPGASIFRKSARILKIAATQHRNNRDLIEMRCDRGAQIVRKLGIRDEVAVAVEHLDEHWDGGGYPNSLAGDSIPVLSRILAIAQHLDVFCMDQGPAAAIEVLCERASRWFDPALVAAAVCLDQEGSLWDGCLPSSRIDETRAELVAAYDALPEHLPASGIETICEAFADVVDAKSPFTYRHSIGVRDAAVAIGAALNLPPDRLQLLGRAALLHDLGKLSIPNTILDKKGSLTPMETVLVKAHPGLSAEILSRISGFREIAVIAGEHHERLDGSGYPFHLQAHEVSLESRILVVADTYGALSENRPYRDALELDQVRDIMQKQTPRKIDPTVYEALLSVVEELHQPHGQPSLTEGCAALGRQPAIFFSQAHKG
jgi:HD-GYP domain-containing protein (c-di-GMP phosphodiesterase class II)